MADATHSNPSRIIHVEMPHRPRKACTAPNPLPDLERPFRSHSTAAARLPAPDPLKARAAHEMKRQRWASLTLRQAWADEAYMRAHLRAARVRVGSDNEPATVPRIKAKLRAVGIHSPEIQDAIGMPLGRFLEVNAELPLCAALALGLESAGRFTTEGFEGAE